MLAFIRDPIHITRFFLFLGCASGILLEISTIRKFRRKRFALGQFLFLTAFALLLPALGFSFQEHAHYVQFGRLHILMTLFFLFLPFVFRIYVPDKDKQLRSHQAILGIISLIILFFTLLKFTYVGRYESYDTIYKSLPLNICNFAAVLIIIRPLFKSRLFDNYILCFGLLGGLMNLTIGMCYGYDKNFYDAVIYESNTTHNLFFTYCIYGFLSDELIPNARRAFQNLYWMLPMFCVFVFTNQIYHFNFFFTGRDNNPILGLYEMFPTFDLPAFGRSFEINPLYYAVVLGASVLILWVAAKSLAALRRNMKK